MRTKTERSRSRPRRAPVLGAVAAAAALVGSLLVPTLAHAAPPQAGTYEGSSTAYTGATVSFEIDANGMMSNFDTESYCSDGFFTWPVQWAGMPATPVQAGVSFEVEWEFGSGDVQSYYELTGTVNADGSASGTGRAGFSPSGTCGGLNFTWTAERVGGGDPDPISPEIEVIPSTVTVSELADSGVTIEGEGFTGNDWVELFVNGEHSHRTVAAWDGSVSVFYRASDLGVGTHELRLSSGSATATTSLTVTEDPVVYDPVASVSPQEVTESELAESGVTITGAEFPPGASVALQVNGNQVDSASANSSGEVSFTYTSGSLGVGTHQVRLVSGELSASASFTVTEDPVVYDPVASVSPGELTVSELADSGVTITGADFPAGADVALTIGGSEVDSASANGDGEVTFTFTSDSLGAGEHEATLISGDLSASASFTVSEDPVVYEPVASVSPQEVTESELVDSGVSITGADFPAGVDVTLAVNGGEVATKSADDTGAVSFTYTSDSLGAGTHTVELTAHDAAATTSFTVTEDPVVYDPVASVAPDELTVSELADSGVSITGADFPAGAEVALTIGGSEVDSASADDAGDVSFAFTSDSLGAGEYEATLISGDLSASASFTVSEDPVVYEPVASVSPQEVTESELADSGVTITGADFPANAEVALLVDGSEADSASANDDGEVTFTFTSDSLGAGEYEATLVSGDLSASASFTLTEDPVVYDPTISVAPQEVTETELAESGVTIQGADFPADAEVALLVDGSQVDSASADDDGEVSFTFVSDSLGAGEHEVTLVSGDLTVTAAFTVVEDAPEPETIPATAPVEDDLDPALEGAVGAPAEAVAGETITVTVDGVEEGTDVGVWLFSAPVYLGTHTVDASGQVVVTMPANTEAGEHTIAVWAAPDTQIGWDTITVLADEDDTGEAGPGDGADDEAAGDGDTGDGVEGDGAAGASTDGSEGGLAATGVSMLPIGALGALLLMLGAATFWLARRQREIA